MNVGEIGFLQVFLYNYNNDFLIVRLYEHIILFQEQNI